LDVIELVHRICLARFEFRGAPDLDALEHARESDFVVQACVLCSRRKAGTRIRPWESIGQGTDPDA
jgi:hypothetical protein